MQCWGEEVDICREDREIAGGTWHKTQGHRDQEWRRETMKGGGNPPGVGWGWSGPLPSPVLEPCSPMPTDAAAPFQ